MNGNQRGHGPGGWTYLLVFAVLLPSTAWSRTGAEAFLPSSHARPAVRASGRSSPPPSARSRPGRRSQDEDAEARTRTVTVPASGPIEPIELGVKPDVVVTLRFQYPLKVKDVEGPFWVTRVNARMVLIALSLQDMQTGKVNLPPFPEGARWPPPVPATVVLKDGRRLGLEIELHYGLFDRTIDVQAPPPAAKESCEAEKKQLSTALESNEHLSRTLEQLATGMARPADLEARQRVAAPQDPREPIPGAPSSTQEAWSFPKKPFTWQKTPPCNANAAQEAIDGGCWLWTGRSAPCPSETFEHKPSGKCYLPVEKRPTRPDTSEGPTPPSQ